MDSPVDVPATETPVPETSSAPPLALQRYSSGGSVAAPEATEEEPPSELAAPVDPQATETGAKKEESAEVPPAVTEAAPFSYFLNCVYHFIV
jgi:hypothetical protein